MNQGYTLYIIYVLGATVPTHIYEQLQLKPEDKIVERGGTLPDERPGLAMVVYTDDYDLRLVEDTQQQVEQLYDILCTKRKVSETPPPLPMSGSTTVREDKVQAYVGVIQSVNAQKGLYGDDIFDIRGVGNTVIHHGTVEEMNDELYEAVKRLAKYHGFDVPEKNKQQGDKFLIPQLYPVTTRLSTLITDIWTEHMLRELTLKYADKLPKDGAEIEWRVVDD